MVQALCSVIGAKYLRLECQVSNEKRFNNTTQIKINMKSNVLIHLLPMLTQLRTTKMSGRSIFQL